MDYETENLRLVDETLYLIADSEGDVRIKLGHVETSGDDVPSELQDEYEEILDAYQDFCRSSSDYHAEAHWYYATSRGF